jgi:ATP-dependent Lon protease
MSGEITLRGRILPVGGIKEKVLAARRAGIRTILLPRRNQKDLSEVPDAAKKDMKFVFVETVDDMLPVVFDGAMRAPSKTTTQARKRKK